MRQRLIRLSLGGILLGTFLVSSLTIGFLFSNERSMAVAFMALSLVCLIAVVLLADLAFRVMFRLRIGRPFVVDRPLTSDDLYITPHSNLPWIHKPHTQIRNASKPNYPLHADQFDFGHYVTNSRGFIDGPEGNRDLPVEKPPGSIRVACLGASTTGNYLTMGGKMFSYPSELEQILTRQGLSDVTVLNCGVGGYNSADLLVRFALQVVDFDPDYLLIYHAYNDIRAYLTPGFRSDYSHARRNLGETYWRLIASDCIPDFGLAFMSYLKSRFLSGNIRNSLVELTARGNIDPNTDPTEGLEVYRRNLQTIVDIATSRGIRVILSTFVFYLYAEIQDIPMHLKYKAVVDLENQVIEDIANVNDVTLVDNAALIARDRSFFVDSIHFSPEGMNRLARNFADAILTDQKSPDR